MKNEENKGRIEAPKVSMPSGGGALRGISEPFKAQSFTGGGGFDIPFGVPEARGFAPSVHLTYSSGNGNGFFGLGFALPMDSISRKTANGIPKYDDTDVFILSSEGDLTPKLSGSDKEWEPLAYDYPAQKPEWHVVAYCPRTEGDFSIIEQWTELATKRSYWKVVTSDNVTNLYGVSDQGRVYNPNQPAHIFEWLLESSTDAHGNKILYTYHTGDTTNIPETIYNAGRDFTSQRYPATIQYGNYFLNEDPLQEEFAFTVVFDYGQLNAEDPDAPPAPWPARPDPFSTYKSGFEIRTARLCRGIFLQHHFQNENSGKPFTTQALLFEHGSTPCSAMSLVSRVWSRGYRHQNGEPLWMADTPAATPHYQEFNPLKANWQLLEADAPGYLNASGFIPVDLDGIGIDGLLYSSSTFTGYLEPLGNGKYAPMRVLEEFPVFRELQSGAVSLASLEGNNVLDLVVSDGTVNGYFERARKGSGWKAFQPFTQFPIEFLSGDKQLADLNGTGRNDLTFMGNNYLKFYPSKGKTGFGTAAYVPTPPHFPLDAEAEQEVVSGFSDFLGDGLSHRFRLCNGSLAVWPCLGNGHFGAEINFANAPAIEGFLEAANVFLIDADGSGATDVVYCYPGYARVWFNQNGNIFSEPIDIPFPDTYSSITSITAGDVCGYGTSSLLFTTAGPEVRHFYYDFSNKQKPYLLQSLDNGTGGLSSVSYTTSVLEQLRDKQEGRIWPTRLPIAVSVIKETTTTDLLTGAVYTQRYRYHDGYFDPVAREFRGFGYVESWDCETYEAFKSSAAQDAKLAALLEKDLWMPPIYTRSWFLTGAYSQTPAICAQYEKEFYHGDTQQWAIPAFELDAAWSQVAARFVRQAYAALAGQPLRTEVYAEDGTAAAPHPYTVSMSTTAVRLVQAGKNSRYCVCMPVAVNSLSYTYDRNPQDPVISQSLVLQMDDYGQPLLRAAVSFPRRDVPGAVIYPEQQQLRVLLSEASYINTVNEDKNNPAATWQYLGVDWQSRSYALGNIEAPVNEPFSRINLLEQAVSALQSPAIPSEELPAQVWSRLLSWSRGVYWNDKGTDSLPYGALNSRALLHHTEEAVLTYKEAARSYGDQVTTEMLRDNCGYISDGEYWWNYGLMQTYYQTAQQFYLPVETRPTITGLLSEQVLDAGGFNGSSSVQYDAYYLGIIKTAAVLSKTVSITTQFEYDYQTMSVWRTTDANSNVSEALCDPLGQVVATTVYGTVDGAAAGDLPLSAYTLQREATFEEVIANPAKYLQQASSFFYYDFHAWKERKQPVNAISVARTLHVQELLLAGKTEDESPMPIGITYSGGLGTLLQAKAKTTPGEVTLRRKVGSIVNPAPDASAQERWLVSGRTVNNNKGQPVEQYLPFFSDSPHFEDQQEIIDQELVPPPAIIRYDPAGRVIRTDAPKGFFSKTVYSPWETTSYDFNDTLPDSPYYKWFTKNYPANPEPWQVEERQALNAALPCYNTPIRVVTDNLGNAIRTISSNLGAITASTIPEAIAAPMTPAAAWSALLEAGYLVQPETDDTTAWVSPAFQPYQSGFREVFQAAFPHNGERLEDYLAQSCMTSLAVYDIQGQILYSADARLWLKMVREETLLFNFKSEYGLGGQVLQLESADAGMHLSLSNMAGNPVWSVDSRGFTKENKYDNLQRPLGLYISGGDGSTALSNQVQLTVYGEEAPDAASHNLIGLPWYDYETAGLSIAECYSLAGGPLRGKTYLRPDYKTESNWTLQAQEDILKARPYVRSTTYNASGQIIEDHLPDGSEQAFAYDLNGLLLHSRQKITDPVSATPIWQTVIGNIDYDAAGRRTQVTYGNGVTSAYTYDALTERIVRTHTVRSTEGAQMPESTLQDIYYTYDPAGHIISKIDFSDSVVFNRNQEVAPRSDYAYDPLYRIISARGRTMPGLNKQEQQAASADNSYSAKLPGVGDLQNLENYAQHFTYDFGDNLVLKRHTAASGNWSVVTRVSETSNHIESMYAGNPSDNTRMVEPDWYDANGNMLVLQPGGMAQVRWNCLDQMASVTAVERTVTNPETGESNSLNDAEYYQYNIGGSRVRKVSERAIQGGSQVVYTEKVYLGSYQHTRTWTLPADTALTDAIPPQSDKNTIVFNDGNAPVLITHIWIKAPPFQHTVSAGNVQYRFQVCDPLDSVTIEVDEEARLLSYEQYYVYGGTCFTLARSQLEADSKALRFCGKELDLLTGLYYYGARYYATWLSRWISPDPAGPVDGPNLYEYVSGNPVNYNDPTGMGKPKQKSSNKPSGDTKAIKTIGKNKENDTTSQPVTRKLKLEVLRDKLTKGFEDMNDKEESAGILDAINTSREFAGNTRKANKRTLKSSRGFGSGLLKEARTHLRNFTNELNVIKSAENHDRLQERLKKEGFPIGDKLPTRVYIPEKGLIATNTKHYSITYMVDGTHFEDRNSAPILKTVMNANIKIGDWKGSQLSATGHYQQSFGDQHGLEFAFCHMRAYSHGGENVSENIMYATNHANWAQLRLENTVNSLSRELSKDILVTVGADIYMNSNNTPSRIAHEIIYTIHPPTAHPPTAHPPTANVTPFSTSISGFLPTSEGVMRKPVKALKNYVRKHYA